MKTYGPYEPIRKSGDIVFVSGQVGINPKTGEAEEGIEAQTHQAIKNLEAVLSGIGLEKVVKTTVFLKDIADFKIFNIAYLEHFSATPRPARSCVEVSDLPHLTDTALLVEIEAVAYTGKRE